MLEDAAVPNRSIYQSLAYNTPTSKYVGSVDFLTPIRELQSVRDKADLASGFVKPLQALPHDIEVAKANDQYYKNKLDEITNYENPHDQLRAVKKLAQMYADDSTSGERAHISQSYNNYNNIVKEATEKLDKGEIDQIGYWKMVHQPYSQFQGTTPNDKGGYNVFQGNKVGKYSDISKEASDFAQQWSANKGYKAGSDGRYINERTHEYVDPKEVENAVYNHLAGNSKYREQLSHYKEYYDHHDINGTEQLHNLLSGIAKPIAAREGFDKYDGSMKADPYGLYDYKAAKEKQELESNIGSSYIEAVNNPNFVDKLQGIELGSNGNLTNTGYKKVVNGKEVPISKEEYDTVYGNMRKKFMEEGEDVSNAEVENDFFRTYKKINKEKIDLDYLYKTNTDIKNIIDNKAKDIYGNIPNNLSKEFKETAIKEYKEAIDKNSRIGILQRNNDSEQIVKKGKLLEQQLQSSTFIPLDKQAKDLAKQEGGDLDYQQLTQDGWSVKNVASSGTIIGTGIDGLNVGDAATVTLTKNGVNKKVRVLMRTPQEEIQNSPYAGIANEVSKIEQSGHDGIIQINPKFQANIKTKYTGGKVQQTIEYTDDKGNKISDDKLKDWGFYNAKTPKDLKEEVQRELIKELQAVGYGHRSKQTEKTTDLNVDIEE